MQTYSATKMRQKVSMTTGTSNTINQIVSLRNFYFLQFQQFTFTLLRIEYFSSQIIL